MTNMFTIRTNQIGHCFKTYAYLMLVFGNTSQFIFTDQSVVNLGLMVILVVGGVIGCALTA